MTETPKPVVEGHQDDTLVWQIHFLQYRVRSRFPLQNITMDPHHNGYLPPCVAPANRHYVEKQAIFRGLFRNCSRTSGTSFLRTICAECACTEFSLPREHGLGEARRWDGPAQPLREHLKPSTPSFHQAAHDSGGGGCAPFKRRDPLRLLGPETQYDPAKYRSPPPPRAPQQSTPTESFDPKAGPIACLGFVQCAGRYPLRLGYTCIFCRYSVNIIKTTKR